MTPPALIEIVLPWPSRDLHPNARVHWARRAKAVKAARYQAGLAVLAGGFQAVALQPLRLSLWLDFYPPDRRKRDDDGLLSSMKAARDGIADALGIDDSRFISHPLVREEVRKGGEVVIRITGGPDA
ncbi:MAG: hypothetical protein ACREO8_10195 [Luteimonas sp.]